MSARTIYVCEVCDGEFYREDGVIVQGVFVCAPHYDAANDGPPDEEEA
jgi:formylmethanofuran dehydrogenase subunit E